MKRLILCLVLLLPLPAHAATPYVVSGVTVDITADSVTDARNQAIIQGQRTAWETLAMQLAPGAEPPKVSDHQLGDMVSDFRVEKEQFGDKRYVGIFTFRFRQNPVRAVFGTLPIISPYELAQRAPVLMPAQPGPTVTTTTTTETTEVDTTAAAPDEATTIINSEAAQASPPLTVANNPLPPGTDINSPIKMMLIELPPNNTPQAQAAQEQLRITPGVMELFYTSSGKSIHMSYRGDTAQLVNNLKSRGVNLRPKLPTQPPIYTLAQ